MQTRQLLTEQVAEAHSSLREGLEDCRHDSLQHVAKTQKYVHNRLQTKAATIMGYEVSTCALPVMSTGTEDACTYPKQL